MSILEWQSMKRSFRRELRLRMHATYQARSLLDCLRKSIHNCRFGQLCLQALLLQELCCTANYLTSTLRVLLQGDAQGNRRAQA